MRRRIERLPSRFGPSAMSPESPPSADHPTEREASSSLLFVAAGAVVLLLVLLQLSFFLSDRRPMTWDPSVHHHLALRLLDAIRDQGVGELARAWTTSENIYPPLYTMIHVPILALVGPSPRAAQAIEGLWLVLLALTVFFAAAPRRDPVWAAALALACATSPLLLSLARVTYIENLLILELAWAAILARRWSRSASDPSVYGFGAVAGAAMLTKWSAAIFLLPIAFAAWFAQRSGPTRASAGRLLRSLLLAALPCLAIAAPWYLADPLHLTQNLAFESFEKVDGPSLMTWSGSGFYLRALASELFWIPVALLLAFQGVRAWSHSDLSGRRFWAAASLGAIVLLTLVPHRQARFAAALVPLTILGIAEVTGSRARSRTRLLLLGLAALSGLALSVPGFAAATPTSRWSPRRGIPELRLGPPGVQAWPHDELLRAAAAAAERRGVDSGGAGRVHLQVERGHPYLNFWTFQSHARQAGVRMVRNPANADFFVSIVRDSEPSPQQSLASWITPDGYRCSLLLPQQVREPVSPDP